MGKEINVVEKYGVRFGKLTLIKEAGYKTLSSGVRKRCFLFHCDCGAEVIIPFAAVVQGNTKSCGCTKVGGKVKHGLSNHDLYWRWWKIKDRCLNPKSNYYANYGGRGITICDEWLQSFQAFYDWSIQNGYKAELVIDRRDNDKGYSPDNCRWVTQKVNLNNTSRNIVVTRNGISMTLMQACESLGLRKKYSTLRRLHLDGKSFDESIKRFVK